MWSTIASRNTKPRGIAQYDVGAPFTRRLQHRKRQQIGRAYEQGACGVDGLGQSGEILDGSVHVGILNQNAA